MTTIYTFPRHAEFVPRIVGAESKSYDPRSGKRIFCHRVLLGCLICSGRGRNQSEYPWSKSHLGTRVRHSRANITRWQLKALLIQWLCLLKWTSWNPTTVRWSSNHWVHRCHWPHVRHLPSLQTAMTMCQYLWWNKSKPETKAHQNDASCTPGPGKTIPFSPRSPLDAAWPTAIRLWERGASYPSRSSASRLPIPHTHVFSKVTSLKDAICQFYARMKSIPCNTLCRILSGRNVCGRKRWTCDNMCAVIPPAL